MGKPSPCTTHEEVTMDRELQVADLFLRRGRFLEFGGSRPVRLPHQSTRGSVLYAGPEPNTRSRTYRTVWRLRHAWSRSHFVLPAGVESRSHLEAGSPEGFILVSQCWPDLHGHPQHATRRIAASLGLH